MAPEVLGNRYEIGRPIGRGAMTRVLEAWDRHGHRHLALKVLVDRLAADEAFVEGPSLPDMLADPGAAASGRGGQGRRQRVRRPGRGSCERRGPWPPHPGQHPAGVDGRVKVTDFRLAQAVTPSAAGSDPATDLQGVGRCLVAMLTGREPPADAPIRLGPEVPAELAAIVLRAAGNHERADRSAEQLRDDLDWFLASVHHGAASTVRPDLTPGHDRATMAALACAPAVQLVPRLAAEPPDRQVAFAVRPPPADRRRRLTLTAGLVGAGLLVIGAAGLLGRQQPGPVTNQALAPNVVGLHRQRAADMLARAQLGIRMVPTQVSDSDKVKRVVAQQPSAGQVLPAGSQVTVLVGTRRPTA